MCDSSDSSADAETMLSRKSEDVVIFGFGHSIAHSFGRWTEGSVSGRLRPTLLVLSGHVLRRFVRRLEPHEGRGLHHLTH